MKYKCSNGHENVAYKLPEHCPVCGSSLLRILSAGGAGDPPPPPKLTPPPPVVPGAPPPPVSPPTVAPAPATPPPIAPSAAAIPPARSKSVWSLLLAVAGLALLVGLAIWAFRGRGDTDRQMAEVAKQYEDAVGVVILAGQKDGQPFSTPIATAWAIDDRVFVSNGHVAQPVAEALANGWSAFIVLNKHPEKKFRITGAICHPKFGEKLLNVDGKEPAVPVYDVGLLKVDAPVPRKFRIAASAELHKLDSGYRVAYLGFPMENLSGGGVDPHNPVANMQSGIITSTTDYWLSKAPFEQALLLAHNLAATGGASGSPIFNASGEVVGVLSAGNIIGQIDFKTGQPTRAPSAALINFAQRIDVLADIYPERPAAKNNPPANNASATPAGKPGGGRILVKWKQNPKTASIKTFLATTLAQEIKTFQHVGGGRLQLLNLPPGKDVASALAQYRKNDLVEYAEPDYVMHMADLPNDPALANGLQWALYNVGEPVNNDNTAARQSSLMSTPAWLPSSYAAGKGSLNPADWAARRKAASQSVAGGVDIGAEEGWQIRNDAEDIIVAVIDTGVDYYHPDLAANLWHNPHPGTGTDADGNGVAGDVYGYNAVAKNGNPLDDQGHGSHVAGIIGAVGNNNIGVCGVAWRVKIMACKCLDNTGSGNYSDIIAGIEYAINNGARVMNLSLGAPEGSRALLEAFQHARSAGVIMVCAAGNESADTDIETNKSYPAAYSDTEDNVISVGAIDRFGQPASFSNYGEHSVHLFAPGVDILSLDMNDGYIIHSGTSMATPMVTGAFALVLANDPPGENYTDAINRLLHNTRTLPSLAGKCMTGGMLYLPGALKVDAAEKAGGRQAVH